MSRPDLPSWTITKLTRERGYWQARVSVNGDGVDVDRRYGSWRAIVRDGPRRRTFHVEEVHPDLAASLQAKVRPIDRKEKQA